MNNHYLLHTILFFSLLSFQYSSIWAQVTTIKNGAELNTPDLNVKVQFYDENIVRVTKWSPKGTSEKFSLAVIKDSIPELGIKMEQESGAILLTSTTLSVRVSTLDGNIEYLTAHSKTILREEGKASFIPVVYESDSGFTVEQHFQLTPDEGIYGLGQYQSGIVNFRDKKVVLVQSNTEDANPFLVSTQNYGILWDNYSKTVFEDNEGGASFWSDMGNNIDYYFVYGKDMDGAISGYRELTGKAPMYGKWAYGYWQSKEHYASQAEVLAVAEKYRKLKMPIDNIIQDWDYWNGNENWGGMFFDKTLYPETKIDVRPPSCDAFSHHHFHLACAGSEYAGLCRHGAARISLQTGGLGGVQIL